MTPYVLNEEADAAQKPKSIMVNNTNGEMNGSAVKPNGDLVDTPDSIPSRSSVSSKSIMGNGKNGKAGTLKRVSFGSSKGSMVETLVYDHQEDLLPDQSVSPFASSPLVNGEDTRLHPAKVRVKFIESQPPVAQVLACPSSTSSPSSPDVTLDFSDTMTSPVMTDGYARQVSNESGVDNPFRPDGELSREADTIVSLIKEGKPITPVKSEETFADGSAAVVANGHPVSNATDGKTDSQAASPVKEAVITPTEASNLKSGANGSAPKEAVVEPGVVEVRHTVIAPPAEAPPVEQVVIKKKPKCKCCVIQ